jgi:hypothetical protein
VISGLPRYEFHALRPLQGKHALFYNLSIFKRHGLIGLLSLLMRIEGCNSRLRRLGSTTPSDNAASLQHCIVVL